MPQQRPGHLSLYSDDFECTKLHMANSEWWGIKVQIKFLFSEQKLFFLLEKKRLGFLDKKNDVT